MSEQETHGFVPIPSDFVDFLNWSFAACWQAGKKGETYRRVWDDARAAIEACARAGEEPVYILPERLARCVSGSVYRPSDETLVMLGLR